MTDIFKKLNDTEKLLYTLNENFKILEEETNFKSSIRYLLDSTYIAQGYRCDYGHFESYTELEYTVRHNYNSADEVSEEDIQSYLDNEVEHVEFLMTDGEIWGVIDNEETDHRYHNFLIECQCAYENLKDNDEYSDFIYEDIRDIKSELKKTVDNIVLNYSLNEELKPKKKEPTTKKQKI